MDRRKEAIKGKKDKVKKDEKQREKKKWTAKTRG